MSEDLTNIVGLATELKIPLRWLAIEADAKRIPFLEIGRLRLFSPGAVRKVLARRAAEFPNQKGALCEYQE